MTGLPATLPTAEAIRAGSAPSASSSLSTDRVLIALRGDARERFEPLFDPSLLADTPWLWPDLSAEASWGGVLEEFAPTVVVTGWETPPVPARLAASPDFPLRYLCHLTGTVRTIVPRTLLERGVVVSNWGRQVAPAVAEHAILLLLMGVRNQPAWGAALADWPKNGYATLDLGIGSLRGRRVGLHGFGAVGREAVSMLRAFGATVSAYSAGVPSDHYAQYGVRECETLEELFSTSDAVIECEGLTEKSRGSVTEAVLRLLPRGAVFVNVARSAIADEAAFVRLARERDLRVALDVFDAEPLPAASPLRTMPGAILTPHIAGPTREGFAALFHTAMRNVRRFLDGAEVEGRVTLEAYDRAT
ncbi:NAD(P)-dependent oxidoreductase [Verrucomicrobium sp. GAS474]|uniref:NAD(P)-dependent oxidoreductase n=1 Tax=Verrucomicrobium sp. GAS474 TaxID=1882831 RepID=UPI0012FF8BCA|nr:NAD(P)-dependent oxidoreductase [Verrucomicrobium sp. GAS474]